MISQRIRERAKELKQHMMNEDIRIQCMTDFESCEYAKKLADEINSHDRFQTSLIFNEDNDDAVLYVKYYDGSLCDECRENEFEVSVMGVWVCRSCYSDIKHKVWNR